MDKEEKNQDCDYLLLRRHCPGSFHEVAGLIESVVGPFFKEGWRLTAIDYDFLVKEGVAVNIQFVRPAPAKAATEEPHNTDGLPS